MAIFAGEELDALDAVGKQSTALGLSDADRRLASAIVLAVLRHKLTLESQIAQYVRAPLERLDPRARVLLAMVAAQRFVLARIPSYAAVSDAVEAARAAGLDPHVCRFINAVGRRIATQERLVLPVAPHTVSDLSRVWSQPEWLVKRFLDLYGCDGAVGLLRALNDDPALSVRVNTLSISPSALLCLWQEAGISAAPSVLLPDALVVASPRDLAMALAHESFAQGFFYVQDEASQLVAHVVAPQPGESILDLCAAPGGKATHLAELGRGQVRVHATDRDAGRLEKVRENIARLGTPNIDILAFEQIEELSGRGEGIYDAVLVDAPCSAVGTIRRHPEVRWRVHPRTIAALAQRQRQLLDLAARLVKPRGRLIYATCSPLPEENAGVLEAFLAAHPDYAVAPPHAELPPGVPAASGHPPAISTWPDLPALDGFSIAVMRRASSD
jgi:16S rRNA (cytosine967-C5)-methyltransferase